MVYKCLRKVTYIQSPSRKLLLTLGGLLDIGGEAIGLWPILIGSLKSEQDAAWRMVFIPPSLLGESG